MALNYFKAQKHLHHEICVQAWDHYITRYKRFRYTNKIIR